MRQPLLRPFAFALCLPATLPGCHAWKRRDLPAGPAPAAVSDGRPVRVTRADGAVLVLHGARVAGDSLVGEAGTPPRRTAVALADVRTAEERRLSRGRTAALVVVTVGAVAAIRVALALEKTADGFTGYSPYPSLR